MGNYFSSEVSERVKHLEREVEELKKEANELKKNVQPRTSKRKFFHWLGFSCFALFAFFWISSRIANDERILNLKVRIEHLEEIKTEQNERIRILEKTKTQQNERIRILEKTKTQQNERIRILEGETTYEDALRKGGCERKGNDDYWKCSKETLKKEEAEEAKTEAGQKTYMQILEEANLYQCETSAEEGETTYEDALRKGGCERKGNDGYWKCSKETLTYFGLQTSNDFIDILSVWLGSKRMRLLYNASVDGFSGESFHKKCDDKGATVTVITSSEGYVFGGYAAVPWSGSRGDFVEDASGESFLFTLKNPQNTPPSKFPLKKKAKAIYNSPDHGPEFGVTAIVCGDYANVNNNSCTDLDDGVYAKGRTELDGHKVFTGQPFFRAKEILVYQVL